MDTTTLVKEWAAAWSAQDIDRVAALFTDDCVYEDATLAAVNHGKEELMAFGSGIMAVSPDFRVELDSYFAADEWAGAEWTMSGTQKGDLPGMPASGKTFSVRGASVFQVRGDKFCRCTDYWDMATFMKQLGFMT